MKLKNLTQIWISSPNRTNIKGEYITNWVYKGTEYLNLQQDLNELDRKEMGEVDYSILKGRTDKTTIILKGDGISLSSSTTNPDYIVKGIIIIGKSTTITLNKNNREADETPSI
jgi:hypothetical protein